MKFFLFLNHSGTHPNSDHTFRYLSFIFKPTEVNKDDHFRAVNMNARIASLTDENVKCDGFISLIQD